MRLIAFIAFTPFVLPAAAPTVKKLEPEPAPVIVKSPLLARMVQYGPRDTVRLTTRPMYITTIVLPEAEKIAQFLSGDGEFWTIGRMHNIAWIKPSLNKRDTNLQLITMSGNIYTFHVVSDDSLEADFKVFVEPKDDYMLKAMNGPARFIEASALTELKGELERTRLESYQIKKEATERIAEEKAKALAAAPSQGRYEYKFVPHQAPFNVAAMWHDGKFSYIRANPAELPAIYEILDDKPNLIQFKFDPDINQYTVDKVLQSGYLQIGKKKMGFERSK